MHRSPARWTSLLKRLRFLLVAIVITAFLVQSYTSYKNTPQRHDQGSATLSPIPVIVFAFNRADNLRKTIDSVLSALPSPPSRHPIFISQDGDDTSVAKVISSYGARVAHLHYQYHGKMGKTTITPYFRIAEHYQTALTEVMDRTPGHENWDRVIMLEDDMLVSSDFFSYFRHMSPLFDSDPSLYCVSAWNENGQKDFVTSATALYRTDCFPGLGWMWSRERWEELKSWTPAYWDDWLREPKQRKSRTCIYPEISRVYTFGREGVSRGLFFDKWFQNISLNHENVTWEDVNVEYLQEESYDDWLTQRLTKAKMEQDVEQAKKGIDRNLDDLGGSESVARLVTERVLTYEHLAELTEMMEETGLNYDHKAGVPRASYLGIVHLRYRGVRIWIVPDDTTLPLQGHGAKWE